MQGLQLAIFSESYDNGDVKLPAFAMEKFKELNGIQIKQLYQVLHAAFDYDHRKLLLSVLYDMSQESMDKEPLMPDRIKAKVATAKHSVQGAIHLLSECQDMECVIHLLSECQAILQTIMHHVQHLLEPAGASLSDLAQCQRSVHLMLVEQASSTRLEVMATWPEAANQVVKLADRNLRDVVMLLIVAQMKNLKDPEEFDDLAKSAYGELDPDLRAQLLQSYHKDHFNKKNGFVSMNHSAKSKSEKVLHQMHSLCCGQHWHPNTGW